MKSLVVDVCNVDERILIPGAEVADFGDDVRNVEKEVQNVLFGADHLVAEVRNVSDDGKTSAAGRRAAFAGGKGSLPGRRPV